MNKYFILERYHSENDIFIKEYNDPNNYDEHYIDGEKIKDVKETSKYFYQHKTNRKTDLLIGVFYIPIISQRFKEILNNLDPHNLEFHPIEFICQKTGDIDKSYNFLNILNHVSCFDWQLSDYRATSTEPKVIIGINKLVIKEAETKGRHIFRLQESRTIILISEYLKQIMEKEKLTGLKIINLEEYGKKM